MRKLICFSALLFIVFVNTLQASNDSPNLESQNPEVIVLISNDNTDQFKTNEILTFKYVSSLNFAGKEKIKKQALEKFKKLASSRGYTHIQIDEETSNKKHHEIRKRNYTVVFVGTAYK